MDARKRLKGLHDGSRGVWEDVKTIDSYRPTEDEWKDPMGYIAKITQASSAFGIAHIIPPDSWNPPFAIQKGSDGVDMESFTFKARRQETSRLCNRKAAREFGFSSTEEVYTLETFAQHADASKRKHFPHARGMGQASEDCRRSEYMLPNTSPMETSPSVEEVEQEFWRIVESETDKEKVVEALYGSDLDNLSFGSGFPMPSGKRWDEMQRRFRGTRDMVLTRREDPIDDVYRNHPWNVNNLSRASKSLLRYVDDELISGVMVPWMYVGSCFSAFNWHIEDHALYSVNYIHFGSPKVWYSVPGDFSEQFEQAMQDALPDLFKASPSLLHELVTQIHPRELVKRGVPVYRVVHEPRSFIVTMPNAYHDGFNTGFNVAESVNFAALPWLPYGGAIVKKYSKSQRPVTISHDALLCRIVSYDATADTCHIPDEMALLAVEELQVRIQDLREAWQAMCYRLNALGLDIDDVPVYSQRDNAQGGLDTKESDCCYCTSDLWLMAFYSMHELSKLACINHAHLLALEEGYPLESICLSYQYSIPELQALVSKERVTQQTTLSTTKESGSRLEKVGLLSATT